MTVVWDDLERIQSFSQYLAFHPPANREDIASCREFMCTCNSSKSESEQPGVFARLAFYAKGAISESL